MGCDCCDGEDEYKESPSARIGANNLDSSPAHFSVYTFFNKYQNINIYI